MSTIIYSPYLNHNSMQIRICLKTPDIQEQADKFIHTFKKANSESYLLFYFYILNTAMKKPDNTLRCKRFGGVSSYKTLHSLPGFNGSR